MTKTQGGAPVAEAEIERKYDLAADRPIPPLVPAGPVTNQAEPRVDVLDATYFDTPDFRLAQAGITLRRRLGGSDEGWHLKLPVSEDKREELRLPLSGKPEKVPGALAKLVRAHTLGAKLVQAAHLRTERTSYALLDAEGRELATLTDDVVTGEAGGEKAHLDRWREIEIELSPGTGLEVLDSLDRAVVNAGAERSRWPSKLRRLTDELVPSAGGASGSVLADFFAEQLDALRRNDIGVRRDVEDSVHQMRVASRRLRSGLKTFRRSLDADVANGLAAELRWLGGELGPARDNEVMAERLHHEVKALPAELVLGNVEQVMTRHFAREAEETKVRAIRALDSKRYTDLLRALEKLAGKPRKIKDDKKELRKAVARSDRKLRKAVAIASELEPGPEQDAALHEVRKKAKRARYAADTVRPVTGNKLREWRENVKAVQTTLGTHHDVVVTREVLRLLGLRAYAESENAFTYGLMHGRSVATAEAAHRRFASEWQAVCKGSRPKWLE
ncbi:CYTH and CHAD domain-containing protein [Amycolatopsis coloradensis]|uniref:CYTH and CHAD domain-containing protein n=1 Tax=Amycolatopsis coloradensis TaxID=76021 RepID=UPI001FC9FCDC|nr:CYTH and CHAD domain-containing protein [Amycolatopsis coloradensis]